MRRLLVSLILVGLFASLGVAAREDESGMITRLYPLHHLDGLRAMLELQVSYPESMRPGVQMHQELASGATFLRVVGSPADHEAIARFLAERDVPAPLVLLQFILLDAVDATLPAPDLPGGASGALKDVRTLFPFKGYRVRHTATLPASIHAGASLGNEYVLRLDARPNTTGSVEVTSFEVMQGTAKGGLTSALSSSFSIRRGETVVLGTSVVAATEKVDPEAARALVVLVTALP